MCTPGAPFYYYYDDFQLVAEAGVTPAVNNCDRRMLLYMCHMYKCHMSTCVIPRSSIC